MQVEHNCFQSAGSSRNSSKGEKKTLVRTINPEQKLVIGHVCVLRIVLKCLCSFQEYYSKCNEFKIHQLSAF